MLGEVPQTYERHVCAHLLSALVFSQLPASSPDMSISDATFPEAPRSLDSTAASDLISDLIQTEPAELAASSALPLNAASKQTHTHTEGSALSHSYR